MNESYVNVYAALADTVSMRVVPQDLTEEDSIGDTPRQGRYHSVNIPRSVLLNLTYEEWRVIVAQLLER